MDRILFQIRQEKRFLFIILSGGYYPLLLLVHLCNPRLNIQRLNVYRIFSWHSYPKKKKKSQSQEGSEWIKEQQGGNVSKG